MGTIAANITTFQWVLVIASSVLLFFTSPWSRTMDSFFKANAKGKAPNWILLTGSLVISWVFAKSIANAADLGFKYGALGGIAYAGYYFSFIVAGVVIYRMRIKGGIKSIHQFLQTRFGRGALTIFSVIIAFRLYNEIWSNTMVIGSYFGGAGDFSYYLSIITFTVLTLAYCLKGGLRSSIFSDAIQMVLFGVLLAVILYILTDEPNISTSDLVTSTPFGWETGLNLLLAAILQSFSYPFHDPVMTDRGFISSPKVTLRSFILAGIIGGICIFLFSFLGIFSKVKGEEAFNLAEIGNVLGPVLLLLVNFIMIVSAASTLDSTFSSTSKLAVIDLKMGNSVKAGRIVMIIIAIGGTIPIFFNPEILSATTVSGTMVIGLTPVFLFWRIEAPPISFYLSVAFGILFGILLTLDFVPSQILFTDGPYNKLLWMNIFGIMVCIISYLAPLLFIRAK